MEREIYSGFIYFERLHFPTLNQVVEKSAAGCGKARSVHCHSFERFIRNSSEHRVWEGVALLNGTVIGEAQKSFN